MTDRKTIDQITSNELDHLYNELDRLHAGEEPITDQLAEPTPGEWLWQFNRVTADHRRNVIRALLRDSTRGRDCFLMNHEKRLADERKAWVIVARIRDVVADMESITGARHWARILRKVVDEPAEQPARTTPNNPPTSKEPTP
jgi:hypothetical protein